MRRGWAIAFGFLLLWGAGSGNAEEAVFNLDWIPYGRDAGVYAAKAEGFYQKEGFSVSFLKGQGSADSIKRLELAKADYGMPDAGTLVISRSKGAKVRLLGAIHDKSTITIYYLEGSGIKTPKDFEGKTLADAPFSSSHRVFPAFALANGADPTKVKWVFMDPGSLAPSLLAGKVDGVTIYITNLPSVRQAAERAGKKLKWMLYADHGLDTYANSLATTDARIAEKPDQVRLFVHATMKGVAWAVENPEKAADHLLKEHPTLHRETALEHWKITIEHLLTPRAQEKGIGYIDRGKMEFTRDKMLEAHKMDVKMPVEELFTNDFLPKIFPKKS